jgi:predicted nucleic acid-binding protein
MNVVDSCGWLEYFADDPNAYFFQRPIEDIEHLVVPTICLSEVFKRSLLQKGETEAFQAVAQMTTGYVVDLDRDTALAAVRVGLAHDLRLADSMILATARAYNATLWTQDAHFKDIEGVKYIEKRKKKV